MYRLELARYRHLNPLRAHVVPDLRHLDGYPWTGDSAPLATAPRPQQATGKILGQFGRPAHFARSGAPQTWRPSASAPLPSIPPPAAAGRRASPGSAFWIRPLRINSI